MIPQASVLLLSMSAATIEALPEPSSTTVMFWQFAVGGVPSATVTVNPQEAVFPETSVPVNVLLVVPNGKVAPFANPVVCVAAVMPVQLSTATTLS